MSNLPLVEKYRPKEIKELLIDETTMMLLTSIIKKNIFQITLCFVDNLVLGKHRF